VESQEIKEHFERALGGESGKFVVMTSVPFVLAAVNADGHAALFARVTLAKGQTLTDGRGFTVKTVRSGNDDYVQITAAERGLPPIFLKLAEYVVERVTSARTPSEATEMLSRSIDEYRRFVGLRRGRLSEALVRGTFAELLFLRVLLTSGMDAETAVTAWRGPWAKAGLGVHDFTFADGRGIEVKSTHQLPTTIRVSSPSQLVPSDQPIDLLVLPVEDAPSDSNGAISFRHYASATGEAIAAAGPLAAEKWDAALEALTLDLSDEWYDKYRFLPGKWLRFEVKESFPHLDIPALPAGIIDVRYSLELPRLAPFAAPFNELLRTMGLS
jgi:hypothetical protein